MKEHKELIDFSVPVMQERMKLPEGKISEIINGVLYVWPSSPSIHHQLVVKRIAVELDSKADAKGRGLTLFAPVDLYFVEGSSVVCPDIVFIADENSNGIIDEHGLHGVPDLIIEVLSKYTRRRDQTDKKLLYQAAGVKEYWMVDPISKEALGYILNENRYDEPLMMHSRIYIRILGLPITF